MEQENMKLFSIFNFAAGKKISKKGSVLAYSLIVMVMLFSIAIGISISTNKQRQGAISTTKSVQALQLAETGSQLSKKKIVSLRMVPASDMSSLATSLGAGIVCIGGDIKNIPSSGGKYNIRAQKDDGAGMLIDVTDCATILSDIKRIRVWGTTADYTRAIEIAIPELIPPSVSASNANGQNSFAIKSDGSVFSWGYGGFNGLGDCGPTNKRIPTKNGLSLVQVASNIHSLGLNANGIVFSWGRQTWGELGDGGSSGTLSRACPEEVRIPEKVVSVKTGYLYSLALGESGNVWAWGKNNQGQLGDGTTLAKSVTPVRVVDGAGDPIKNITAIAASAGIIAKNFSLALDSSGNVWTWGYNDFGQLGNGIPANSARNYADMVKDVAGTGNLSGITAIAAAGSTAFALDSDKKVWLWGGNMGVSQFAAATAMSNCAGTNLCYKLPVRVVTNLMDSDSHLTNIKAIAAGYDFALALNDSGEVYSFGVDKKGEIGNNLAPNNTQAVPIKILGLTNISAISAGFQYALAIDSSAKVWAWGYNNSYQLGDGTITNRASPVGLLSF